MEWAGIGMPSKPLYNRRSMFGKRFSLRWVACAAFFGAALGLFVPREPEPARGRAPAPTVLGPAPVTAQSNSEVDSCVRELDAIAAAPALPGSPLNGGEQRAHVLARAKAEPVLFERAPASAVPLSPLAAELRKELYTSDAPFEAFPRVFARLKGDRALARQVLLTDGYLYAESPELGLVLANAVMLSQLFRAPEIVVQRGADRALAKRREDGDYEYASGPELGERVRLWLFDRVWIQGEEPTPSVHFALRALQRQLGFDQLRALRLTAQGISAELRYGATWVKTALRGEAERLSSSCEVLPSSLRSGVAAARSLAARRERMQERLRWAVARQVEEALPFDEPKTEDGQQDGKLRPEWRTAYRSGQDRFTFNEDRYFVFDNKGRPRVPQVCIDFITDTLERASGTWWQNRQDGRQRVLGRLRFDELGIDNHRSVERFLVFAAARPEWFDLYELRPEERVPFRDRARFYAELYRHRDRYIRGDIVTILGLRDDEKLHYHSFFVFDSDPLTGMPTQLAANAGQPRIRSIENELTNAPRRSILSRIRPRLEWLESVILIEEQAAAHDPSKQPIPG
jgi:hypothetical protein